jgi:hypothetical protein
MTHYEGVPLLEDPPLSYGLSAMISTYGERLESISPQQQQQVLIATAMSLAFDWPEVLWNKFDGQGIDRDIVAHLYYLTEPQKLTLICLLSCSLRTGGNPA